MAANSAQQAEPDLQYQEHCQLGAIHAQLSSAYPLVLPAACSATAAPTLRPDLVLELQMLRPYR